jgi:hypothetical protein
MLAMNTPSHIWFCRSCQRKGVSEGEGVIDLMLAKSEHDISSPDCTDLIRITTIDEADDDTEISRYKLWDED